jgi:hypothetical protein
MENCRKKMENNYEKNGKLIFHNFPQKKWKNLDFPLKKWKIVENFVFFIKM